jgi:hypothetical protein
MAVFWAVVPCSLVEVYRRFRGACCLRHQVNFHQTTRRNNPEDNHFRTRRRENLKCQIYLEFYIIIDTPTDITLVIITYFLAVSKLTNTTQNFIIRKYAYNLFTTTFKLENTSQFIALATTSLFF